MIGRIEDRRSFERLRRPAARIRIDPLWCSYVPDPMSTNTRVAFAIGRATGNAVTRNRLRRRLRAILAAADLPSGLFLVGAGPAATELTFDELRRRVDQLAVAVKQRVPA